MVSPERKGRQARRETPEQLRHLELRARGPQGPKGDPGESGMYYRSNVATLPASGEVTTTFKCDPGDFILSEQISLAPAPDWSHTPYDVTQNEWTRTARSYTWHNKESFDFAIHLDYICANA